MHQLIPFYLSHFTYFFLICGYLCVVKILMIFAYLCFSFFQVFSNENVLLLQLEKKCYFKNTNKGKSGRQNQEPEDGGGVLVPSLTGYTT